MSTKRYYIYHRQDPLNGWYEDLTDLQAQGYRLAGYFVSEVSV